MNPNLSHSKRKQSTPISSWSQELQTSTPDGLHHRYPAKYVPRYLFSSKIEQNFYIFNQKLSKKFRKVSKQLRLHSGTRNNKPVRTKSPFYINFVLVYIVHVDSPHFLSESSHNLWIFAELLSQKPEKQLKTHENCKTNQHKAHGKRSRVHSARLSNFDIRNNDFSFSGTRHQ